AHPPLGLLAGDVGLGRFPLGIQRVELLLEPLLGGLAGVDGTADGLLLARRHAYLLTGQRTAARSNVSRSPPWPRRSANGRPARPTQTPRATRLPQWSGRDRSGSGSSRAWAGLRGPPAPVGPTVWLERWSVAGGAWW